jgi:hypothetical protein
MPAPPPCPVPCMVTAWSEWSACGGTCAPSLRQRVRNVISREMFGGMICPNVQESDQCFTLLPLCVDATLPPATTSTRFIPPTPRPTPSPTPVPPTPVPTAPPQVQISFATMVMPTKMLQLGEAGSLLAVNNVQPDAEVTLTWANGAIGVSDAADNAPGEIAAPFAAQFQFTRRRAMRSIAFTNFSASESATLIAFNRLGRRRAGETAFIEIKDPNTPLMPRTAIGFDTYEIRPSANSSFGVASIESPLPDSSMFVAQENTTATAADGDSTGQSSLDSEGFPVYAIAIIAVVGGVVLIALFVVVFLVGKRRGAQNREPTEASSQQQTTSPSTAPLSSASNTQQLYASLDHVPKQPAVYTGIFQDQATAYADMEMASARDNYDDLHLLPGTAYNNGALMSAPSVGIGR